MEKLERINYLDGQLKELENQKNLEDGFGQTLNVMMIEEEMIRIEEEISGLKYGVQLKLDFPD